MIEFQLLAGILLILVGAISAWLISYLRKKGILAIIDAKEHLAIHAVKFVEEYYKDIHGEQKLDKACEWLAMALASIKIKATPEEIKGFVLSALRTIKDEYGDRWAHVQSWEE